MERSYSLELGGVIGGGLQQKIVQSLHEIRLYIVDASTPGAGNQTRTILTSILQGRAGRRTRKRRQMLIALILHKFWRGSKNFR